MSQWSFQEATLPGTTKKIPKAKKIPGQHTSCSVVACGSKAWKTVPKPRFFRFPSRDKLQKQLWVAIIGRLNPDGSLWQPKNHDYICSNHFVGGMYSRTRGDVNYTPSLNVNWSLNLLGGVKLMIWYSRAPPSLWI